MPLSISAPVGAWEDPVVIQRRGNQRNDVIAVQTLLTKATQKAGKREFDPKGIDGAIARAPRKSGTLEALQSFQKQFMSQPDRRVDPGGKTWRELLNYDNSAAKNVVLGPPQLITYAGKTVPFFEQFDSEWGSRTLGNAKTLSKAGCAITSIAMILKYYGRDIDPGTLDDYLDDNNGYSGDNVVWSKAFQAGAVAGKPKLVVTNHQFTDSAKFAEVLDQRIQRNWPTLAHIDYGNDAGLGGDHWVVIVGRTASGHYIINDPGTSQGDGASNPQQQVTILGESTRKGGLNLVRLCLFDVA